MVDNRLIDERAHWVQAVADARRGLEECRRSRKYTRIQILERELEVALYMIDQVDSRMAKEKK